MIRLATSDDVGRLNEIANHADVHPFISDGQELDLTDAVKSSIVYMTDLGAIVFTPVNGAVYQFHTMFLPEGRGKHAHRCARLAAYAMFTQTDAMELITYSPHDVPLSRPPKTFGFREWFTRSNVGRGVGATWYRLHINDWIVRDKSLAKLGAVFHDRLEAMKREQGCENDIHPEDSAHDHMVGASMAMVLGGKPDKGLMIYNSWAGCAGYHAAIIESRDPLKIFTGDAVWTVNGQKWEAELCQ